MLENSLFLSELGLREINLGTSSGSNWIKSNGNVKDIFSPVDGKKIASVVESDENAYEEILKISINSFKVWRKTPAPRRGEVV